MQINAKRTALVVVDMQNAFIKKEGSISRLGIDTSRTASTIEPIKNLIDEFYKIGQPVIFTKMALKQDYSDAGILNEVFPPLKELGHCVKNSWDGEIIEEIKPSESDYLIEKSRFSGFYRTNLEEILRENNIESIVMVGVATNICLESTVRDAFYRDFRVFVPEDATASYTEEMEAGSLNNFRFGFANVTSSKEIIEAINSK